MGLEKRTISLYHRDGRVFKYDVEAEGTRIASKVTEHIQRIADSGYYRHNDGKEYELIPVILDGDRGIYKIKSTDIPTNFPDRTERT
ncbi:hypothetical protein B6U91_01015 [Candidatus Pacearchaeota archaeon ex4484_71]|nr:MAG: hypothetical protein B6U91_01015 [Candidatus Pacearchaeota archaeon ex4484_71]